MFSILMLFTSMSAYMYCRYSEISGDLAHNTYYYIVNNYKTTYIVRKCTNIGTTR